MLDRFQQPNLDRILVRSFVRPRGHPLISGSWLGDNKLPLMDTNTENQNVISTLQGWITNLTQTFSIDGIRIDGQS